MAMFLQFSFNYSHAILFMLLSLYVLPAYQISFEFSNFTDNFIGDNCSSSGNYVCLQGNASVIDGVIELLQRNDSVGRVAYSQPVRIWNNNTGKTANFTTAFSFKIDRNSSFDPGDGFAFFLSSYPSIIANNSGGGRLGLEDAQGGQKFVAVEFDTFKNDWDVTEFSHVGIDVNSMTSKSTENVNFLETIGRAIVNYNADTLNLSVSLFYEGDPLLNGSIIHSDLVNIGEVLPENVSVGFTAATGKYMNHNQLFNWTFTSSLLDDDTDVKKNNPTTITDNNNHTNRRLLVIGTTVGVVLLITSIIAVLELLYFRKKSKAVREGEGSDDEETQSIDDELEDGRGPNPSRFPYQALVNATNNFNSESKIGEGGFGPVYKGFLSDLNLEVAIKRVSSHSKQGKKEYISEIKIISRLRHKNLVQLIGWCHQRGDLLLVYELMPNRSLDFHLFNQKSFLPWILRYKIALDLAFGLLYLHEEWEQCVVHRDVKSSNIMLDSSFNAKLGDFGLARLSEHGFGLQTTFLAGTLGYMAPECVITGKASKESDVYSFGVVALEIACGRRSIDQTTTDPDKGRLVEWVWRMYGKGTLLEAIDSRFEEEEDVINEDQARRLMVAALWCAHPDFNARPSIRQVINVLNLERSMPSLPSSMPLPTYNSLTSLSEECIYGTTSSQSFNWNSNTTDGSSPVPLLSIIH